MDILYKYRNSGFFMAAISLLLKGQHICGLLMVLAGIVLFKIDLGECKNNACFTFNLDRKSVSIVISCILAAWLYFFRNTSATDASLYVIINGMIQTFSDKHNSTAGLISGSLWMAYGFHYLCGGTLFKQPNYIPVNVISVEPEDVSIYFDDLFYSLKDPRLSPKLSDELRKEIMF